MKLNPGDLYLAMADRLHGSGLMLAAGRLDLLSASASCHVPLPHYSGLEFGNKLPIVMVGAIIQCNATRMEIYFKMHSKCSKSRQETKPTEIFV